MGMNPNVLNSYCVFGGIIKSCLEQFEDYWPPKKLHIIIQCYNLYKNLLLKV